MSAVNTKVKMGNILQKPKLEKAAALRSKIVHFHKKFWFWYQTEIVSEKVYAEIWPVIEITALISFHCPCIMLSIITFFGNLGKTANVQIFLCPIV